MIDSLPYYDTTNVEYKLLRAYYLNDTNNLKEIHKRLERINTKTGWELDIDSCIEQKSLADINAEEAYRFNFSSALFCAYKTSLTITKYKDSIKLNTLVFQYAWDSLPCKIIEESTIAIDSLSWEKFRQSLVIADFWGLKQDNGKHGVDGSTLDVYGFKKGTHSEEYPDKVNFISRWNPAYLPIFDCFYLLLKFSKTRKGCIIMP